ncbi:protein containing Por secretion system C-terminal sorting domain [Lentimicrobium saccharophilum]|uniref:Protein containing Por secretion system C-terminal sorting domain n=1 Tax=Lentimicrobium saccharophilum TaxID=1678841 RepID=A0A0S7BVM8_9BACT|nr:T9SS type A sorting domain-containing protein [Lentimicrobium saccharophilum]GAP42619.1 protein containing Por secretion system C-terminal sorting domain [Lentimicrobium saccharophilum]
MKNNLLKWALVNVAFIALLTAPLMETQAQIYEPEGLNMPGTYNSFNNPPTNLAFASSTQVTNGRITKITTGQARWQTVFSVAASGGDITGGSYQWLFTSGPSGEYYNNKWAGVNVQMNTLQTYTHNTGSDNSVTFTNGKWYTMNWKDIGYSSTEAIFIETDAEPVSIASEYRIPSVVYPDMKPVVYATLSAPVAGGQGVYVRYSNDDFTTSTIIELSLLSGNTYRAELPNFSTGTIIYYFFTSKAGLTSINHSNADMFTINFLNNGGSNYSYTIQSGTVKFSAASADWSAASTWEGGTKPSASDQVVIQHNVSLDENATVSGLLVNLNSQLTINDDAALTVSNELGNNGAMLLSSSATGTGSLTHSTSGVPATVERYIEAATWETAGSGWHLLSSPVAAQGISGDWTPTGTGNDYDFYAFDETASTDNWLNQKVGANNITTFIPGKGYLVAYQQTDTKTFSGNLNVADVTLSGLTNTGTSAYPGWHLAGNPFASAINWGSGTWTKTNINAVAQVWSSADGSYKTTTEQSDIIPAMNGFMVYTTGSGELTIPADAREHNAANWYKSDEEFILLKANDLEGLTSQSSIVRFNPSATEAYDADFDAYFLAGFAPMFYSVSGSSLYALNTLPAVSNELAIPFGFVKNTATNYNIELAKNIPATIVYLTDIKTGTVTNLTEDGAYHFTAAEGDDANRFTLHFGTLGMNDPSTTAPVNIYAYGGVVYLNGPDAKASVTITDLTGRVVMAERVNGNGLAMLNAAKLPKGVYVVTAVAGSRVVSAKVIL